MLQSGSMFEPVPENLLLVNNQIPTIPDVKLNTDY
jgi:hypothetical protein